MIAVTNPGGKVPWATRFTGATLNAGSFVMRAERGGRDTLLSGIVGMVAEARRWMGLSESSALARHDAE